MSPTSATHTLLTLAGEVALLLWSIQVVTAAVTRAFGSRLRHLLATGLASRWRAFSAGLLVTTGLQSSTATAMMISSLSGAGAVALVPALAMMLGANIGTTLIVQVMTFDFSYVVPLFLLVGLTTIKRGRSLLLRECGQAAMGLGLMLLTLHLLQATMRPVEHSEILRSLLASLSQDSLMTLLLAALLAWAAHSSVAAILFVMSLAGAGVIGIETTLTMVLGCNLGSALNPCLQAFGREPAAQRAPLGNLTNRLLGCVIGLMLLPLLAAAFGKSGLAPSEVAATFHLLFNIVMAALFLGALPWLAALLKRLLPEQADAADPSQPRYLDEAALKTPALALANASREVLRMADVVEEMLHGSQAAFGLDDALKVAETCRADDVLDALYNRIQLYVGAIDHRALDDGERQRLMSVLALAINLEHIGDIVDKNLMEMAAKRIKDQRRLPETALRRIEEMHESLCAHLRLAIAVFISGDEDAAMRLVREKEMFRELEREATLRHVDEMRSGRPERIIVSAFQLDVTRDLKRIEGHIAATVHDLLERNGVLRPSRLREQAI